jgi:hypothetical protein
MARASYKDDRLPKIVLFGEPYRAKIKVGRPQLGWEDVIKNELREIKLPGRV